MEFHSCPGCGSDRIVYKKTAQTIGQVVGAIGGIAVGALLPYSAHNMPAPKLPQQALQYLTFAKTGALIGGQIGIVIDTHVLDNGHWLNCGTDFQPTYWTE